MPSRGIRTHNLSRRAAKDLRLDRVATGIGSDEGYATTFHLNVRTTTLVLQTAARQYLGYLFK